MTTMTMTTPPGSVISPIRTHASPNTPRRVAKAAERHKAAAAAAAVAAGNGGGRLKRLTNTDNVFTVLKTADGGTYFRCKA